MRVEEPAFEFGVSALALYMVLGGCRVSKILTKPPIPLANPGRIDITVPRAWADLCPASPASACAAASALCVGFSDRSLELNTLDVAGVEFALGQCKIARKHQQIEGGRLAMGCIFATRLATAMGYWAQGLSTSALNAARWLHRLLTQATTIVRSPRI